jgi:hypothetical protein
MGTIIGPFCARFINVSQWSGDSETDVGDIAYVSILECQAWISGLMIAGPEPTGNWYRDGQSWL